MVYGLIFGWETAKRLPNQIVWWFRPRYYRIFIYCQKAWRAPSVRKIACDFCAEVAVLMAVFPALEFWLGNQGRKSPAGAVTVGTVIRWSLTFVLLFLLGAIMLADKETDKIEKRG